MGIVELLTRKMLCLVRDIDRERLLSDDKIQKVYQLSSTRISVRGKFSKKLYMTD